MIWLAAKCFTIGPFLLFSRLLYPSYTVPSSSKNRLRNGLPAKFEVGKKVRILMIYVCSKMHDFPECFSDFEICRPAISKPVVLEKSDIPQKKALNSGN